MKSYTGGNKILINFSVDAHGLEIINTEYIHTGIQHESISLI